MSLTELKSPRKSSIVWTRLDEIEAALARGVTRQQVLDALNAEHGTDLKIRGFDTALWRARKARDKAKQQATQVATGKVDRPTQATPTAPTVGVENARPELTPVTETPEPEVPVNNPPVDVASALLDMKTNGLPKSDVSDESAPIYVSKRNRNK